MSTTNPVQYQKDLNINAYLNLIAFTLVYYDYLLTLRIEVERYWAHWRAFSLAGVIFYLNRYVAVFGHVPIIVQYFWTKEPSEYKQTVCEKLQSYHQYYAVVVQIMVGVMLVLRTYALYERNRKVLTGMVSVTCAAIGFGVWAVYSAKSDDSVKDPVPFIGCASSVGVDLGFRLGLAWVGMLIFDTMIFSLTLYKALSMRRVSGSLLTILLRDGTVYFAVMIVANLGNILTFFLGEGQIRGAPTTLTNVISSIMISRLMLNLRDPNIVSSANNRTTIQYSGMMSTLAPTFNTSNQPFPHHTHSRMMLATVEETEGDTDFEESGRINGHLAEEIELAPVSNGRFT